MPYGEGATFSALAEAIRRHAGILETDGAGLVEARLSAAVPPGPDHEWIRTRLRPLVGLPAPAATTQDNFAAWTSYFQQVAATAPTALVLEDLHWAGEDMLDFVRHLITQQVAAPLLVIATARTELLELHPGFLDACPGTVCLALSPLSPADMAAVAAEVAGGRLSDDTADFVAEQAGGNPLFGEEYVRLLVDRDLLRPTSRGIELDQDKGPPPLPDSVQAVIGARLDLLPAPLKATLSDAAVLGETFWRGGVAAIGGGTEAEVDEALGALAGKQFVRAAAPSSLAGEPSTSSGTPSCATWPTDACRRRCASANTKPPGPGCVTRPASGPMSSPRSSPITTRRPSSSRRRCTARPRPPSSILPCSTFSWPAEKTEPLDGGAAESYYSRALAVIPDSRVERFRLLARRGAMAAMRGRAGEAVSDLGEAIAGLKEAGETRAAADALNQLSQALLLLGDPGYRDPLAEAVELVERDGPSQTMVDVLLERAAYVQEDEGPRQGLQALEQVFAVAESLGKPTPAVLLSARGAVRCALGDAGGLADIRRAIEAAEREGRRVEQAGLLLELAWSLVSFEGPGSALQALRAAEELSRRARMDTFVTDARSMAVRSLYWAGEWDTALTECRELLPVLEAAGDAYSVAIVRYVWSLLLLGRGDAAAAEPLAAQALAKARDNPLRGVSAVYLVAAAAARCGIGDDDGAVALLEECEEVLRDKGDTVFVYLLPLAVRTALAGGHGDLARRLAEPVAPVLPFGRHVRRTLDAQLLEMDGEAAAAAAAHAAAARGWHDFGIPYEEAHALLGRGRCLLASGDRRASADALERAELVFAGLGATLDVDQTHTVLRGLA